MNLIRDPVYKMRNEQGCKSINKTGKWDATFLLVGRYFDKLYFDKAIFLL